MMLEWILLALALGTAGYFGWTLAKDWRREKRDQRHLSHLVQGYRSDEVRERPSKGRIRRRLLAAGLPLPPIFWSLLAGALALLTAFAFVWIWHGGVLLAAFAAGLTLWFCALVVSELARFRAQRFEAALVDAIDLTIGSLTAGENLEAALSAAAQGSRQPVRRELEGWVAERRGGQPIERSARRLIENYDSEGTRLFAELLTAKTTIGGPMTDDLASVNRTIRQRLRLRQRLSSHLSGAQTTAVLIALLPYAMIPILTWLRPESLERLFQHPLGWTLVLATILLQIGGFLALRQLSRAEL